MHVAQDVSIGAGAASSVIWIDYLHIASQEIVVVGGALLVLYRIWRVMYKNYKRHKNRRV